MLLDSPLCMDDIQLIAFAQLAIARPVVARAFAAVALLQDVIAHSSSASRKKVVGLAGLQSQLM